MGQKSRRGGVLLTVGLLAMLGVPLGAAAAPVAGSQTIGVSTEEMKLVAMGESARKDILGKPVYNDSNQKVGNVEDIIVTPDRSLSYAIIGVGGFLGIGTHDVAIPVSQLKQEGGKFILPGASKDALKAMPPFTYAKK
jgi:sporulation protein YlmC with PRC-barrel domain